MGFRNIIQVLVLIAALLGSCERPKKLKEGKGNLPDSLASMEETTTKGYIRIGIDESMEPVLMQIVNAFHAAYRDAHLEVWVKPEGALMADLLADSIRLALVGRDWAKNERSALGKDEISPKTDQLGTDAIALLVNKENPVESISFDQLKRVLQGEIQTWSQLSPAGVGPINLVFDHSQSGIIRYVQDQVMGPDWKLPSNAYAAGSHPLLFDYVGKNKTALGFAGSPWLSDEDSPRVKARFDSLKYLRIISPDTVDLPGVPVGPYPNEIALHRYPLYRGIYALSREHFTGLGTGFVVYAAGELGQRILLKAGILPEFMPPRYVVFTGKELDTRN